MQKIKIHKKNNNVKVYKNRQISADPYLSMTENDKDLFINAIMNGGFSKGKDISSLPEEMIKNGADVEMEHVEKGNPFSSTIARKIAIDHLFEDLNYYEKLAKMEKE